MRCVERFGEIGEESIVGNHQRLPPRDENIVIARHSRKGKDRPRGFA